MTQTIISTNPGQGYQVIGEIEITSFEEIKALVKQAHDAKKIWKSTAIDHRLRYLTKLYNIFVDKQEEFQTLIIQEVGKTVKFAQGSYQRFLEDFTWFLEQGKKALEDEITYEDNQEIHKIVYEPHGVTAVIAPWNHPFGMFVWGVIPNLIAGNTVVFKHSEECPLSGKFIDEVIKSIELPQGVFQQVYGNAQQGQYLLEQELNLIWFTGSTEIGQLIYQKAGEKFVKAILETGGSNPGIVFADANLDQLTQKFYKKRFDGSGQGCDALKRLLVEVSILDDVIHRLKEEVESKIVGENNNPNTEIGSVAAKRQLEKLESQVTDAVTKGAKIITGGEQVKQLQGAYYQPTILTEITPEMAIWHEEVFGPVLSIIPFKTEAEAIEIANCTQYGLGATVYTQNSQKAHRVSQQLEAGTIEINGVSHWRPCNPFGGYKKSGMGRERGIHGFRELCQIKLISEEKIV